MESETWIAKAGIATICMETIELAERKQRGEEVERKRNNKARKDQ